MKKFCESLRKQQKSYEKAKISNICKVKFENKYVKVKKYCKVRDHCQGKYRGAVHITCNLRFMYTVMIIIL